MKTFSELAQSVSYAEKGTQILLNKKDPELSLMGKGRSAFAFRIGATNKVLKVFFPAFTHLAEKEASIYQQLIGIPYFPILYEWGANYIVIDYIEGNTLFQCLQKGIPISSDHIKEIDQALAFAREVGLNPSDIHLRNIFITRVGTVKIIDVVRYRQNKWCSQWDDLKTGYNKYYVQRWFPKKIPEFILNLVASLYKSESFSKNLLKKLLSN
ncbi:protein kinase family protein [Bacillus sp. 31A1R]|uniref:Protein kinase family protein n=1 Tax=Robertmurraya mangrovi TaxID=3098077 RepID=A0ABU5J071_9BACI|nr:protein kinase family protein [Bacillus sp. 31A1R]MDZ5472813.1 protein kinase family protein [Bacillus sp. 31A1R]